MSLALPTALGALLLVPCTIAIASGGAKDAGTRAIMVAASVVGAVVALYPYIGPLRDLLGSGGLRLFATAAGVLGVLAAVRAQNRILGTLACTAGVLLAALAWDIVGGW